MTAATAESQTKSSITFKCICRPNNMVNISYSASLLPEITKRYKEGGVDEQTIESFIPLLKQQSDAWFECPLKLFNKWVELTSNAPKGNMIVNVEQDSLELRQWRETNTRR